MMVSQETKDRWRQKIKTIIEAKEKGLLQLNPWEADFMFNMEWVMNHEGSLTMNQSLALNSIYRRIK